MSPDEVEDTVWQLPGVINTLPWSWLGHLAGGYWKPSTGARLLLLELAVKSAGDVVNVGSFVIALSAKIGAGLALAAIAAKLRGAKSLSKAHAK